MILLELAKARARGRGATAICNARIGKGQTTAGDDEGKTSLNSQNQQATQSGSTPIELNQACLA